MNLHGEEKIIKITSYEKETNYSLRSVCFNSMNRSSHRHFDVSNKHLFSFSSLTRSRDLGNQAKTEQ